MKTKPKSDAHVLTSRHVLPSSLKESQFYISATSQATSEFTSPRPCTSHGLRSGKQLRPSAHTSSGPWEGRDLAVLPAARLLGSAFPEQAQARPRQYTETKWTTSCLDFERLVSFPVEAHLLSTSGNDAKPLPLSDLPLPTPTCHVAVSFMALATQPVAISQGQLDISRVPLCSLGQQKSPSDMFPPKKIGSFT